MIFHITTPKSYEQDFDGENLTHPSLESEGFIHCATLSQVAGVLERYFVGINEITLLHLDESLLKSELKYEIATADEAFPHVFGKINKEAIVKVEIVKLGNLVELGTANREFAASSQLPNSTML